MVHAKSYECRRREAAALKETVTQRALEYYTAEREKPEGGEGTRKCCQRATNDFLKLLGVEVKLNHGTLLARYEGRPNVSQARSKVKLIQPHVARMIIKYAKEMALRGWPLNFARLQDIINTFLRSNLGADFEGVGRNLVYRFVDDHSDELRSYWTRALDSNRGQAVNPAIHEAWMDLLYSTVEEYNIAPECIAGSDEIGFNSALIQRGRAIGPKGRKVLYQRNDGPRENITVIATILADGTTIPPSVIYKGDGYQVRWSENNPLNASIGHSKKGWTDGEIGVEWIKIFDEHTREKADGRDRLLLVDGHNSHYTEAFLAYAREHRIHVLCYPAHTTHVYQGLDVVVFAKLKTYWNEEKIKMQVRLTKSNFLQCLAPAWTRAMTAANIKSAFRKTGVYPLDRTTIKESDLAPSRATTTKTAMPLDPPEHVRILTSFFRDALRLQDTTPVPSATTDTTGSPTTSASPTNGQQSDGDVDMQDVEPPTPDPATVRAREMRSQLAHSAVGFLVDDAPITSSQQLPDAALSPLLALPTEPLAAFVPQTDNEHVLHAALLRWIGLAHEHAQGRETERITLVLQERYCERVRSQLVDKEAKKKSTRQRLMGDGLPRLLTSDAFFARVQTHEKQLRDEAAQKAVRARGGDAYKSAMAEYSSLSRERDALNDAIKAAHAKSVAEWEAERDCQKKVGKRARWTKPVREALHPAIAKPKKRDFISQASEEMGEEDEGEEEIDAVERDGLGEDSDDEMGQRTDEDNSSDEE